jgi:hypothetical protein
MIILIIRRGQIGCEKMKYKPLEDGEILPLEQIPEYIDATDKEIERLRHLLIEHLGILEKFVDSYEKDDSCD